MAPDVLDRALDAAIRAARLAGDLIRAEAGRIDHSTIEDKGIHDLVTHVDHAAQECILKVLDESFPDFGQLAEEGAASEGADRSADGCRWIVDPIDGTTNFAHGVPPYAVSIALQEGSDIVVGVVLDVSRNELFSAVRGRGMQVDGDPATVSRTATLDAGLVTTGFPYRAYGHVDVYLEVLGAFMRGTRGVRRPGSASVDLAYVACGRFDGFFETGLMPWDVAAGTLLVREAGGTVSDFSGGGDPVFGRQIVASNGRVHARMLDVLAPMRSTTD